MARTGSKCGQRWSVSWTFSGARWPQNIGLKFLATGATKILELECDRTTGLFWEAGLLSCMPEGLGNPRSSPNGPGMTSEGTEIISIILYCSYLF